MFEENRYLATVKRIEIQLKQKAQEHNTFDLTNLVAIFSQSDGGPCLAVFNTEETGSFPDFFEVLTLHQLLEDGRDLLAKYDGMIITFDALALVLPGIVTRGPRFYPIEHLYRRLSLGEKLPQTQLKLARTLFSALVASGELMEKSPEYAATTWLSKVGRLFRLSLPALLERHQVQGLLAIVPDENFKHYLDRQQCSLVYITASTGKNVTGSTTILDLQSFANRRITTEAQLSAAFEEVELFNHGINPRTAGFVDLRKELRRDFFITEIRSTVRQLALLCEQRSSTDNLLVQPARMLAIEYELSSQELDDMIAIEFLADQGACSNSSVRRRYYLRPSESEDPPGDIASLDDLFAGKIKVEPDNYVASLRSLRDLFSTREGAWYPLSGALLRLDRPQVLARSSYLTSRLLNERDGVSIDAEKIIDEAASNCYVYSLAEPYYNYWPRGNHRHQLVQSYENFHEQLGRLAKKENDPKRKSYFRALKIWWNYEEHDLRNRKKLLQEAIKELESLKGDENVQYYPTAPHLYELFSVLLSMFSSSWQVVDIRERLSKAGYSEIARDGTIVSWDYLDFSSDLKQPSLLFFESLRDFLKLSEESYVIRIKDQDTGLKSRKLFEMGVKFGEQIGLNFGKYMRRYSELRTGAHIGEEDEQDYLTGKRADKKENNVDEEIEDPLLLPVHEQLWMRSLYRSAIDAHASIIHNLQRTPVPSQIAPIEVTQYESTNIEVSLTGEIEEMLKRGREVEVILFGSRDYDIQSRVVRKKFGIGLPVSFPVAFRTRGYVALLLEYIIDKKEHYPDEVWVHVIDLATQARQVKNPYQYGDIVLSPQNYYGRRDELKKILDELYEMASGRGRQNFRLHGIRRSGKTSLLHMIRKSIEEPETRKYFHIHDEENSALEKWHPVFYDLQELPHDPNNSGHLDSTVFFKSLTQKICEALHWSKEATYSALTGIDADFAITQNMVGAVKRQLGQMIKNLPSNERILVLLDEGDLIAPERDGRFLGQLRSIILSHELRPITWLLTSVRVLQAARAEVESPLHNIFASITLRNLDPEEARRLILEPARKENIYFEPEAVEAILQQTGRQPFFLQVVCHTIVDQLNKEQTAYVSRSLAHRVIEQLLEPGTVIYEQCGFLWEWAKNSRRVILNFLAHYERGTFKRDLVKAFGEVFSEEKDNGGRFFDFAEAWNELFANDLVSQDQNDFCRLTVPMFQRWLKQRELDPYQLR